MSAGSQHPATIAVSAGRPHGIGEPLNHPITLASNFRGEEGVYSRTHGTPGWIGLEEAVGALEGGRAVSFSSGMAAAAAAVFALAPKVLVLPTYSYLGVRALVDDHVRQGHLQVRFVDIADTAAVVAAIAGADVVWVETPTNPTLDVADIPAICAAAAAAGAKVVVDSTFATPVCARPLADGATIVIHSGTKFIGGHSDLLIGLAVAADDATYERLRQTRLVNGSTPGALEAFLALRGVRTLPGFGAMVAFVLAGGAEAADAACRAVRLIVPATSLGGVESSMERRQKYAGDAHVPPGLIRMSVGIEHVDDIWADLAQALAAG